MKSKLFPVETVRPAFRGLPQRAAHMATQAPEWTEVFTPDGHEGALDPNRPIVIGDRGTGKSFWSSVLTHAESRRMISTRYPRLNLAKVVCELGFSDASMAAAHPDPSLIADLMRDGFTAEELWRAVTLKYAPVTLSSLPHSARHG